MINKNVVHGIGVPDYSNAFKEQSAMCIYCGTTKYRKIYECHFGEIPYDETGRSYEIHHIDGNRKNNDITNLKCVSIQEHYDIHYSQGDWGAAMRIASKMKIPHEELSELAQLRELTKSKNGNHQWQNTAGSEFRKKNAMAPVLAGTHHWLGPESNRKRVNDGTHNFLDKDAAKARALKLIEHGTHNFLDKDKARKRVMKRMDAGIHNFQIQVTCPHCNKTGMEVNMKRYHFDNCELLTPRELLQCPHCDKTGGIEGMKRWHFDNCKFKCD